MTIFGFRPFKGRFNLGNSDDIPTNNDGTLIGAIKQINTHLTANNNAFIGDYQSGKYGFLIDNVFYPIGGGGSGLKCVKYGTFASQGTTSISISDLGFSNPNDYVVLLNGGGAGGNTYVSAKSATAFSVTGASNSSYQITGSYQILAASD